MKKLIIPIVFALVLCLQPAASFAASYCFSGGGGATGVFWIISGGRIDEKPFSGSLVTGSITLPTWGSIIRDAGGNIHLSLNNPARVGGGFSSVWSSLSGPTISFLSGQFDNSQNGTFDGSFTLTQINCATMPTAMPDVVRPPGSLGVPASPQE